MNIEFIKSFEKDLGSIRDVTLLQIIRAVIEDEEVETAENLGEVTNIKKLKGEGAYYRIRVGDYRIGITAD
jgi:mRNA interferase RelE/StbE